MNEKEEEAVDAQADSDDGDSFDPGEATPGKPLAPLPSSNRFVHPNLNSSSCLNCLNLPDLDRPTVGLCLQERLRSNQLQSL